MIVVTGTKRSGTSLWMQMFATAGHEVIGTAFPRAWREHLEEHNPGGFYESELRRGIYHATNPHPKTGRYLHPDGTRRHAVKVFVPGLVKSDHAFLDRVIGSVRSWREVTVSLRKLRATEARVFHWEKSDSPIAFRPPEIEWLEHVFLLVRNVVTRRYPALLVGHRRLMREPEAVWDEVLDFLGPFAHEGAPRGSDVVEPKLYRNAPTEVEDVVFGPDVTERLDAFVEAVDAGRWREPGVLAGLNDVWTEALRQGWTDRRLPWNDPRIIGVSASS